MDGWLPKLGDRVRLVKKIACLAPVGVEGEVVQVWESTSTYGMDLPAKFCVDAAGYPNFVTDASNLEPVTAPNRTLEPGPDDRDPGNVILRACAV